MEKQHFSVARVVELREVDRADLAESPMFPMLHQACRFSQCIRIGLLLISGLVAWQGRAEPDTNPPVIISAVAQKNLTAISVLFSEPIRPDSLTNLANFRVFQTSRSSNELATVGISTSGNSGVILWTSPRVPGVNYSLRANGVRDASSAGNEIAPDSTIPLAYQADLVAVNAQTTWRFYQAGQSPGTNWMLSDFDDSLWPSGAGVFQAGLPLPITTDPIRTTLSLSASNGPINAYYFRTLFDLPGPLVTNSVRMHDLVDDGAVFYLNGSEVLNVGMPGTRPVTYDLAASRYVMAATYEPALAYPGWAVSEATLEATGNCLAAEVHQSAQGAPDVAFAVDLEGTISGYLPKPQISAPAAALEGSGTLTNAGHVWALEPLSTNLVFRLFSTSPADVTVPSELTIPAGETNVSFNLEIGNDALFNGPRTVTLSAQSPGLCVATATIRILDDETNALQLVVAGAAKEGDGSFMGEVQFEHEADTAITVTLKSDNPGELWVPAEVVVPAGSTSAIFQVTVVDDVRLDGETAVTLWALVPGWPSASGTVRVQDNEKATLAVQLPDTVVEGAGAVTNAGKVVLGGIAVSNVVVTLASSLPTLVLVPPTVTVSAGYSNAAFAVSVLDDAVYQEGQVATITASAPGFPTGSSTVEVLDNDADHFVFEHVPSPQYTNAAFRLSISALRRDGSLQTNFNGFATIAAAGTAGPVPLEHERVGPFVGGLWSGTVQALQPDRFVQLRTLEAPGTSDAFDVEMAVWRTVDIQAEDLIYDPQSGLLYASVPSLGGAYSNSVTGIDPESGLIVSSVPVGEIVRPQTSVGYRSGALARSDDGQYVYVVVSNALAIQQVVTGSHTPGFVFPVGKDANHFYTLSAADLLVMPGSPETVAVARNEGYNAQGVAIYDRGVRRQNTTPEYTASDINRIEPSSDPAVLLGYCNQNTGFGLFRIGVNSSGAAVLDETPGLISGFGVDIRFDGGLLFATSGAVVDPVNRTVRGTLGGSGLVTPDTKNSRAFYLMYDGGDYILQAYDLATWLPLKAVVIPADGGGAKAMVRWGTNGLALASTSGKIYLVQSPLLFPQGTPADVSVSQHISSGSVRSNVIIQVVVTNAGPEWATETILSNSLPAGVSLVSASVSQGTWTNCATGLRCCLGNMQPGSSAELTVVVRANCGGWITNRAVAMANELDNNLADNLSVQTQYVRVELEPDAVSQISIQAADLAYDPRAQHLLLSVPGQFGPAADMLLMLDPVTGIPVNSLFVGDQPGRLALSADCSYLYVATENSQRVSRVDLGTQVNDLRFALGSNEYSAFSIEDMAVLPGQPRSIAVSRATAAGTLSNIRHEGMAVYDDGKQRPNTGPASTYSANVIEFGDDAAVLYAHDIGGAGLYRFSVDAAGVSLLDSDSELMGGALEMVFAESRIYTTSGLVLDPATSTQAGVIPQAANSTAVLFDAPTRRVLFLQPTGSNYVLQAYEAGSLLPLGSIPINGVNGSPIRLVRWGADGLAFCTTANQLFLLRTSLLPTNPPAELNLCLTSAAPKATLGSNYFYQLQVSNQGPSSASGVRLTNELPEGCSVADVRLSQGTWSSATGAVVCDFGQLNSGASATASITVIPATTGLLRFCGVAGGQSVERTNADNRASWMAWSSPATGVVTQAVASLGCNDIATDPVTGRLYMTLGPTAGPLANRLVWLDPYTGEVGRPLDIGPGPNRLAISSDGRFLYCGLDDANAVRRVDVLSSALEPPFSLGTLQRAVDLSAAGTNSGQVVVYRAYDGKIALYIDGIKAPTELTGWSMFGCSDQTSDFYVCDGWHLDRAELTADGLVLGNSQTTVPAGSGELKSCQGLVFLSWGVVVDPQSRTVKARLPVCYNAVVEPDASSGRVYYATKAPSGWVLKAFDLGQWTELGEVPLEGLLGTPKRLVRWGADGLALCTSSGQLFLTRGLLVPAGATTDLTLHQTAPAFAISTNDTVEFDLLLTNNGPASAQGIRVSEVFSLPVGQATVDTTNGTTSVASNQVSWEPGSLPIGSTAVLTIRVRPTQSGTLAASATASHAANDPTWADNTAWTAVVVTNNGAVLPVQLSLPTGALCYDPARDLIYASIPGSSRSIGNTVISLDPRTGSSLTSHYAGSNPNLLALSDDARFLYVSLDGSLGVRRLDLQGRSSDLCFPLDRQDLCYAEDLEVQPGHPETLVASLGSLNWSPPFPADVMVYDNGSPRGVKGGPSRELVFSGDGSQVFGYVPSGQGYGFVRMSLGPSGILATEIFRNFVEDPGELKLTGGRLYSYSGQVIEPNIPLPLGRVGLSGPMCIVPNLARAFYLVGKSGSWTLEAVDLGTLQVVGTQTVPGVQGTPANLIHCGADRFAFRTSSNQVFIVSTPMAPTNSPPPANLSVTQWAAQDFFAATETLRFAISLTNQGPGFASNVVVAVKPPSPVLSAVLQAPSGTLQNAESNILCNVGSIPAHRSLSLDLSVVITNTATYTNFVSVSSTSVDPDLADNTSVAIQSGLYFQRAESVRAYNAVTHALAYDPVGTRLFAVLAPDGARSQLIWLDPHTASLLGSIPLTTKPNLMRITDDAQFLYLAESASGLVQRVHLPSLTLDLGFTPTNAMAIGSMAVVPGNPHAVVLSYWGTTGPATTVFDDGIPRPDQVVDRVFTQLTAASDGTVLYGYDGSSGGGNSPDLFRLGLDFDGLHSRDNGPSDVPGSGNRGMVFASDRLLCTQGSVINPADWSLEAPFVLQGPGQSLAAMPSLDRVAFLTPAPEFYEPVHVGIYALSSRERIADLALGYFYTSYDDLTYCGADRLAFRSASCVYFLRSSAVATNNDLATPFVSLLDAHTVGTNGPLIEVATSPGHWYALEVSTNLVDWVTLTNFYATGISRTVSDPIAAGTQTRFYRADTR